jgi:chemotaxis protein CheD
MEPDSDLPQIHVHPGEWHLLREPALLCTLLGSCVGITFWVRRLGIGALCHPMMPTFPTGREARASSETARRYVDFSIRQLATQFDSLGARRSETEVKLFGGADVLQVGQTSSRPSVGKLNCETAVRVLHSEGYEIAASSLGGESGLQIYFNTANGEVLLRRFGQSQCGHRRNTRRSKEGPGDA